jgi:hypothetical protein
MTLLGGQGGIFKSLPRILKFCKGSKVTKIFRFQWTTNNRDTPYPPQYDTFEWTRGIFSKFVQGFWNFGCLGMREMLEGDSADTCAGKFPHMLIGGQAEGLACAETGARTPISVSKNVVVYDWNHNHHNKDSNQNKFGPPHPGPLGGDFCLFVVNIRRWY